MNKKKRSFLLIGFVLLAVLLAAAVASAKSPAATADIPKINYVEGLILTQEAMEVDPARAQRGLGATLIKAKVTSGPDAGQEVVIINRTMDRSFYNIMAKPGDKVILALMTDPSGKTTYHIADYERGSGLIWLAGLFIVLLLLFGRGVGLRAVFVIGTSLVILYYGFVGQVLAGGVNVLLLTFIVAILISAITLFSVSGREPKTWAAFIGTMGGVAAAGLLAATPDRPVERRGDDFEGDGSQTCRFSGDIVCRSGARSTGSSDGCGDLDCGGAAGSLPQLSKPQPQGIVQFGHVGRPRCDGDRREYLDSCLCGKLAAIGAADRFTAGFVDAAYLQSRFAGDGICSCIGRQRRAGSVDPADGGGRSLSVVGS